MQRYIEVLEDGYINTYQININDQAAFNKYKNELKSLSTNHIKRLNCSLDASYFKYVLDQITNISGEVIKIESGKSISYDFLPNVYDIHYKKYPLLYEILMDDEDDMFYCLYMYINNLDIEDSSYGFDECDDNISMYDKREYVRNVLQLLSFKKIDCRLAHNIEEYNKIQEKTNIVKKLIDSLYQNNKVKTNKK